MKMWRGFDEWRSGSESGSTFTAHFSIPIPIPMPTPTSGGHQGIFGAVPHPALRDPMTHEQTGGGLAYVCVIRSWERASARTHERIYGIVGTGCAKTCSSDSARVTDHQEAGQILKRKKLNAERAKPAENAEKISPMRHQAAHLPATLLRNASRCSILAPGAGENARDENAQTGFPPHFPTRTAPKRRPQAAGELPADAQPHRRIEMLFAASALSLRPLR
jgi:hypothetical protein